MRPFDTYQDDKAIVSASGDDSLGPRHAEDVVHVTRRMLRGEGLVCGRGGRRGGVGGRRG